jgi:hypothetical protein
MHILRSLALLLLLASSAKAGQYNEIISIGDSMPRFADLPATDGNHYSSDDFNADVLVLVSLANHCPWVRGMDAGLIELVDSFAGQSVQVVGFAVNHREDDRLPAMIEHGERVGYNFVYLFDESQQLGRDLGATRTPEYFVFDADRKLGYTGLLTNSPARETRDGEIMYTSGEPTAFHARDAIAALLAGEMPDPAETRPQGCSVKYE